MIPQLAPIKLPPLRKLCMSDKNSVREECWTATLMIFTQGQLPTGQSFFIDDEDTIWIWENEQDRLWLLGHTHASVNYFSFETGHPFLWRSESLLKKSRTESFSFDAVSFHLCIGVDYWMPTSSDVLPCKDGLPNLIWEMEKKKLLPASSRRFIRGWYQQLKFASLGFKEPDRTRTELLSLLCQTTCETTIATIQKLHPEFWRLVCVQSEVEASEARRFPEEEETITEAFVNEKEPELIPAQTIYVREEDGSITHHGGWDTKEVQSKIKTSLNQEG